MRERKREREREREGDKVHITRKQLVVTEYDELQNSSCAVY